MKKCMIQILTVTCLLLVTSIFGRERVDKFTSVISIQKDSSLLVQETIAIWAEGQAIHHGIYRDFPTTYTDRLGMKRVVSFDVTNVSLDGKWVPYSVCSYGNGVRVRIGSKSKELPHGSHTYTITYRTNRQMGFFEHHDELYWNVTGNGWTLPIDQVCAKVIFPQAIPKNEILFGAYTGYQGAVDRNYRILDRDDNSITFGTTQQLKPQQGLTIAVGIPTGIVIKPSALDEWIDYAKHNRELFLIGFMILQLLILLILFAIRNGIRKWKEVVIPRDNPPDNMSPGLLCYIMYRGNMADTALTAEIVQAAVEGALVIKHEKGSMWSRDTYTLIRDGKGIEAYSKTTDMLCNKLFSSRKKLQLIQTNRQKIKEVRAMLERNYKHLSRGYFMQKDIAPWVSYMVLGFSAVFMFLSLTTVLAPLFVIAFVALVVLYYMGLFYFPGYTQQGEELLQEINAFKKFLKLTEKERTQLIGDMKQDETVQFYETYLPYAIALGVDRQWTKSFGAVLAAATTTWYQGSRGYPHTYYNRMGHFSKSLTTTISSSSSAPGRSSGFGSGGSSGGGGGGGGGGGW